MSSLCGVAKVYMAMELDDGKALRALLSAPTKKISASAISQELAAAGYQVSYQTISRHRSGACSCGVL